jgi:hypothetical protein
MPSVRDVFANRTNGMARRLVGWALVIAILALAYAIYLALA